MNGIKIYNNLIDIPQRNYQGYVWYSDQTKPITLYGEKTFKFQEEAKNPFVIEALLFVEDENVSVMIRHTDYIRITEYKINKYE